MTPTLILPAAKVTVLAVGVSTTLKPVLVLLVMLTKQAWLGSAKAQYWLPEIDCWELGNFGKETGTVTEAPAPLPAGVAILANSKGERCATPLAAASIEGIDGIVKPICVYGWITTMGPNCANGTRENMGPANCQKNGSLFLADGTRQSWL
jgi:hypothetical protein